MNLLLRAVRVDSEHWNKEAASERARDVLWQLVLTCFRISHLHPPFPLSSPRTNLFAYFSQWLKMTAEENKVWLPSTDKLGISEPCVICFWKRSWWYLPYPLCKFHNDLITCKRHFRVPGVYENTTGNLFRQLRTDCLCSKHVLVLYELAHHLPHLQSQR